MMINPDFGSGALTMKMMIMIEIMMENVMALQVCDMMVTYDDDDVDKLVITDECVNTNETLLLIRRRRMQSPFVNTRLQDATVQALVHLD